MHEVIASFSSPFNLPFMNYPAGLTAREVAILGFIMRGFDLKLIPDELGITYNTVRSHIRFIHWKTDTHSMQELYRWALLNGFDHEGVYSQPAA